jgi:hypothetical protein
MKCFRSILLLALLFYTGFPALAQVNDSVWVAGEQSTMEQAGRDQEPEINIRVVENRILVENLPREMILEIYNIMGVKVYSRRIPPGTGEYPVNLRRGYYILKIGKTTKKIAIR